MATTLCKPMDRLRTTDAASIVDNNGPTVCALPGVARQVALFISDTNTFFSYLSAMHHLGMLGPLEHFHQLGLAQPHDTLWPMLKLTGSLRQFSEDERRHVEGIGSIVTQASLCDWEDLGWLCQHLNPLASVHWEASQPLDEASSEWFDQWTSLRLTHVTTWYGQLDDKFPAALAKLSHLTSLTLVHPSPALVPEIFAVAVKATHLRELKIPRSDRTAVPPSMLRNAIKWLQSNSVEHFQFHNWKLQEVEDSAVKHQFYSAMLNCPTLKTLAINESHLTDIDFAAMALPIESLSLEACKLDSTAIQALAAKLPKSSLTSLKLHNPGNKSVDGLESLLRALPHSNITKLHLGGDFFQDNSWQRCIPLLGASHLDDLTLTSFRVSPVCVNFLAQAIQTNHSIRTLKVTHTNMQLSGSSARTLVESATSPDRCVQMLSVDIGQTNLGEDVLATLTSLAAQRGATFLYRRPGDD